ncbi:MAG: glucose-6-phosphate dehydrogenase [Actinobacteria bacterium]|nr:glucose-6-phosphate dehydrogenase [Actinomycetota bacterium]
MALTRIGVGPVVGGALGGESGGLSRPPPQSIVILGGSGDLTRRKLLPALYHLGVAGLLPERYAVVGVSRSELDPGGFRRWARTSSESFCRCDVDAPDWRRFEAGLSHLSGDLGDLATFDRLAEHLGSMDREHGTEGRRLFYLATPPSAFAEVIRGLAESGLAAGSRVIVEKPFGHDAASAGALNRAIAAVFDETRVFRIDHYLGKETVQNLLVLRFANAILEPLWNRRHVDHVQMTVAEDIGIEGRGSFYEEVGALRDMVQPHILQVLTFVAMEPPGSLDADALLAEKLRVLRAIRPVEPSHVVRGQYLGYRSEPGVASASQAETFVALRLEVENDRWRGVPFFVRTGKSLARRTSEITIAFREPAIELFRSARSDGRGGNHLTVRIQPDEGIFLSFMAKRPGAALALGEAALDFWYEPTFKSRLVEAYERLLYDAMQGDRTLFTGGAGVERAWEILEPALADPPSPHRYLPGSWGPREADALIAPRRWNHPG